jgi:hypothetical protein
VNVTDDAQLQVLGTGLRELQRCYITSSDRWLGQRPVSTLEYDNRSAREEKEPMYRSPLNVLPLMLNSSMR